MVQGLGSDQFTLPTFMKGFIASTATGLGVGLALGINMEVTLSSIPPFFLAGGYDRNPLPNLFPLIPASCYLARVKTTLESDAGNALTWPPRRYRRGEGSARK